MSVIDLAAFEATPLVRTPYDHLVVPDFVPPEAAAAIMAAYPRIDSPGLLPLSEVEPGLAFRALIADLEAPSLTEAVERKFDIDLDGHPTMITLRGRCQAKDGRIHTDSETKLISALIYFNEPWESQGGQLRILNSGADLEDYASEVPPNAGTLVMFRRGDNSWHGHKPYIGPRRYVMVNWMRDYATAESELSRHRLSARVKRFIPALA